MEVEGEKFNRRLDVLIPLIEKEIHTSNFEDVSAEFNSMWMHLFESLCIDNDNDMIDQIEEEEDEKAADRLLFCYLTLIIKLIKDCGFLELHKPADLLNNIWSMNTYMEKVSVNKGT